MADIKTGGAVATPQCPFYLGERGGGEGVECASVSKKGVLYQWCGICYVFLKVHRKII